LSVLAPVDAMATMNINLTPELEEFVRARVDSGMYNSASEVMREALRLLVEREQLNALKLAALRDDIRKGIESGPAKPWSVSEAKASARAQSAARRSKKAA
jgi:antitoxin ParD1/3/4